ncbi:MAG: hypothetical protein ACE5EX_09245, partial [Phycisphaerae bacterium]
MKNRTLRIATTSQLVRAVREAGFEPIELPALPNADFNRTVEQRIQDGAIYRPFLEERRPDLVLDINTAALTLVPSGADPGQFALTTSALSIPYVACFLD